MKRTLKVKREANWYLATYSYEVDGWWDTICIICDDYIVRKFTERYMVELYRVGKIITTLHVDEIIIERG
jgi:uncharacterized membrane protein